MSWPLNSTRSPRRPGGDDEDNDCSPRRHRDPERFQTSMTIELRHDRSPGSATIAVRPTQP
ncbi:MAG: hypothetical protein JO281_19235 [Pseudonocardiales bacterium]|nr:hypothetical protein [Pseudonocardiales bacterium]